MERLYEYKKRAEEASIEAATDRGEWLMRRLNMLSPCVKKLETLAKPGDEESGNKDNLEGTLGFVLIFSFFFLTGGPLNKEQADYYLDAFYDICQYVLDDRVEIPDVINNPLESFNYLDQWSETKKRLGLIDRTVPGYESFRPRPMSYQPEPSLPHAPA